MMQFADSNDIELKNSNDEASDNKLASLEAMLV